MVKGEVYTCRMLLYSKKKREFTGGGGGRPFFPYNSQVYTKMKGGGTRQRPSSKNKISHDALLLLLLHFYILCANKDSSNHGNRNVFSPAPFPFSQYVENNKIRFVNVTSQYFRSISEKKDAGIPASSSVKDVDVIHIVF